MNTDRTTLEVGATNVKRGNFILYGKLQFYLLFTDAHPQILKAL